MTEAGGERLERRKKEEEEGGERGKNEGKAGAAEERFDFFELDAFLL